MSRLVVLSIGFLVFLSGCKGTKLSVDNFLKIRTGMNQQDVILMLGQPTRKEELDRVGARIWTWTDGDREITVLIDNNGNVMDAGGGNPAKTQKGLH